MSTGNVEHAPQTIRLRNPGNVGDLLHMLATSWSDLVMVNVGAATETKRLFFCAANLDALLAIHPEELVVEALPEAGYKQLARQTVDQVIQAAQALRTALRTQYVADAGAGVVDLVLRVDRLTLLLDGYALQRPRPEICQAADRLRRVRDELASSSVPSGDNVRCMDDLQYEMLPALQAIRQLF